MGAAAARGGGAVTTALFGAHAPYVWGALIAALLAVAAELAWLRAQRRRALARIALAAQLQRERERGDDLREAAP